MLKKHILKIKDKKEIGNREKIKVKKFIKEGN